MENEKKATIVGMKRKRFFDFKTFERPKKKLKLYDPIPETFRNYPQYEMLKKLEVAEGKIDNFLEERRVKLVRGGGAQKNESRKITIEVFHDNMKKISKQISEFDINVGGLFDGGDLISFSEIVDQIEVSFPEMPSVEIGIWKGDEEEEGRGRHSIISFERRFRMRKGRKIKVEAKIYIRNDPPLFKMDEKIQNITKNEEFRDESLSLEEIVGFFFDYFKEKELYVLNNPTMLFMDDYLRSIFKREVIHVNEVANLIYPFLSHPDPLIVTHSFEFNTEQSKTTKTFEIKRNRANLNLLLSDQYSEDVLQKEEEMDILLDEAKNHLRKKKFLQDFSEKPIDFSYQLICSQTRDINEVNNFKMDSLMDSKDFEARLKSESLICMEEVKIE